jgi:hypothetical protein
MLKHQIHLFPLLQQLPICSCLTWPCSLSSFKCKFFPRFILLPVNATRPLWNKNLKLSNRLYNASRLIHSYHFTGIRNRVHSALWVQLRSYLEEKVAAPV